MRWSPRRGALKLQVIRPAGRRRMSRFANLEFGGHREDTRTEQVRAAADAEAQWLAEAEREFRGGYFESALRRYGRVLGTNPHSAAAWAGQVRLLLELGETAEANGWADKALERLPETPDLLALKGAALARGGDLEAALAFSDASIRGGEAPPGVWLARGEVLLARREKSAEYSFAKAVTAAPGEWLWLWLASRAHLFHRQFSRALKLARQALSLEETAPVIWLQLARCQWALGLAAEAGRSLAQAEQLDAACPELVPVRETLRRPDAWQVWVGRWRRFWHA